MRARRHGNPTRFNPHARERLRKWLERKAERRLRNPKTPKDHELIGRLARLISKKPDPLAEKLVEIGLKYPVNSRERAKYLDAAEAIGLGEMPLEKRLGWEKRAGLKARK